MRKNLMKRILGLILAVTLCLPMIPVIERAEAEELTAWENVLQNCKYTIDGGSWSTAAADGGAGHLQGIVCDDEQKYMYMSFTNMMVKVDMRTGAIVGTVKGMAAGSISSGAHIGCIAWHDGKIYGSLEYKAAERWYICVFDGDAITGDMHYTDPGVMYGLYVPQVGTDFVNELAAGEHNNNESSMGHRYGTGGIDGITFGQLPGKGYDTDGDGDVDIVDEETYMIVTYGPYGNAKRYDNENFVFLVYDLDEIDSENLLPFNETRLSGQVTEGEKYLYKHKLFAYTGNQQYGVQNLEYDKDTGDWWLECYGRPSGSEFPSMSRYVIDGSVPLYMDEVEVGQSVTGDASGFVTKEAAHATAALYTDYEDGDGDSNTTEQEMGWHMTLKCICSKGDMANHEAVTYGATGHACKVCGSGSQFSTGIISLGGDYFYGASSGATYINSVKHEWGKAYLYKLDRSTWKFTQVTEPARLMMSYTMDAADTYEQNGQVYLKDVSGHGYDALVEGTYAATNKNSKVGGALGFRGDQYGSVLDRVHMTDAAMTYINNQVEDSYSYSFWMYKGAEMDRFTPIIGMYRDEAVQKNLYAGVFEWRYRTSPAVLVHRNTSDPDYRNWVDGTQYIERPSNTSGGDGSWYPFGNGSANPNTFAGWHHYVVIRSGSNVSLYMDGVSKGSGNIGDSTLDNLSAFEIGGYIARNWVDSNVRNRFTGLIDDVRIYSGGLTAAEVSALYAAGAADSTATGTGAVDASAEPTFGTYSGTVLAEQEDPIVHLKMDNAGTIVDLSGNGIDGIASNVTATTNYDNAENSALYFDGRYQSTPSKVTLAADDTAWLSAQINGTKKMTISFWMNMDIENGHRTAIVGVYDKSGRPIGTFETRGLLGQDMALDGKFALAFTAAKPYSGSGVIDEKTYEQLAVTNTTSKYTIPAPNGSNQGGHYGDKIMRTWYYVVGELDQTTNKLRLYIDGSLVQEVDIAANTLGEIGHFMIGQPAGRYYQFENASNTGENGGVSGRQGWSARDGFVGTIDEVKVYNRILSAEEILTEYLKATGNDQSAENAEKALQAQLAAEAAQAKAEEAQSKAEAAQAAAEAAQADAETAQTAAEAAQAAAEAAQAKAETAQAAAEAAKKTAEEAAESAGADSEAAKNAQAAAEAAQKTAEDAQKAAETAQAAAETAQTKAETAQAAAEIAQTTAETAATSAQTAQTAAEAAQAAAEQSNVEAAEEAQAAAESAAKSAEEAAAATEQAAASASSAQESATSAAASAESAADAAESAANATQSAADSAQSAAEAEAAKKAAEEAQAKAEAAQAEAEKAKAEAEAAKKAAEEAQANAAGDKSDANASRSAAQAAQAKAEAAQKAAEDAAADAKTAQAKAEAAQKAQQQANADLQQATEALKEIEAAAEATGEDKAAVEALKKAAEEAAAQAKADKEAAEALKAEAEAAKAAAEDAQKKAEAAQKAAETAQKAAEAALAKAEALAASGGSNGIHLLCCLMACLIALVISGTVSLALRRKKTKK